MILHPSRRASASGRGSVEASVTLRRKIKIAIGGIAVLLVVVAIVGFRLYRDRLTVSLPDYPPVKEAMWLKQGWEPDQRTWFHHGDQGTQTLNIPYEWFVALEQPRISL